MAIDDPPHVRFAKLVQACRKSQRDNAANRVEAEAALDKAARWIFANRRDDASFKPLTGLVSLMRFHQVERDRTRLPTLLQRNQIAQYEEKADREVSKVLTHKQPSLPLAGATAAEVIETYARKPT